MAFGGYLGLFIGASILSLYDISINFFTNMVTKFKSKLDSEIKTGEIKEYNEGQWETVLNDKSFQPTKKVFTTPHRISPFEMELENCLILIKIQEDLVKQGKTIKKLEKLIAKQDDILANPEKLNKKYVDG